MERDVKIGQLLRRTLLSGDRGRRATFLRDYLLDALSRNSEIASNLVVRFASV
jgi:hypothetical protein